MERAETLGLLAFKNWVGDRGEILNTSRDGVGYDCKVKWKDTGLAETYEIKGTAKVLKIPDMSVVEFDESHRLKADFLFVAGNVFETGKEVLFKIPREALTEENLKLKQTYHIRLFQNQKKMGKYRLTSN